MVDDVRTTTSLLHTFPLPGTADTSAKAHQTVSAQSALVSSAMDTVTESRIHRDGACGTWAFAPATCPVAEQAGPGRNGGSVRAGMVMIRSPAAQHCHHAQSRALPFVSRRVSRSLHGSHSSPKPRHSACEVDQSKHVAEVMTKPDHRSGGVSADAALGLLRRNKIEKLPIVDGHGRLTG